MEGDDRRPWRRSTFPQKQGSAGRDQKIAKSEGVDRRPRSAGRAGEICVRELARRPLGAGDAGGDWLSGRRLVAAPDARSGARLLAERLVLHGAREQERRPETPKRRRRAYYPGALSSVRVAAGQRALFDHEAGTRRQYERRAGRAPDALAMA